MRRARGPGPACQARLPDGLAAWHAEQRAEWDVLAGAWVLPTLSELADDRRKGAADLDDALGAGIDAFAVSRRFVLAASGLAMLSESTALMLASLLRR